MDCGRESLLHSDGSSLSIRGSRPRSPPVQVDGYQVVIEVDRHVEPLAGRTHAEDGFGHLADPVVAQVQAAQFGQLLIAWGKRAQAGIG